MKFLSLICCLIVLSGCSIQTHVADKDGSIQFANKENAIHAEKDAVHVEKDAVRVEKDAIHVEKDAIHVEKDAFRVEKDAFRVEKDAFGHVEKGAVNVEKDAVTFTVQPGAIQMPMSVQSGAVSMPVAEGAVKFELNIKEGAIVIKGVEPGGIQTQIETPWWAWIIMAVLGVGWLITKFRKHTRSKEISSVWDVFF